jgi:hypothetical protein
VTKQELERIFREKWMTKSGQLDASNVSEMIDWIAEACQQSGAPPFSGAFTGMHDKNGNRICEGDQVKLYYKGEFVTCRVVYDVEHAAFFLKWPDGYVNHYFMNGSSYEIIDQQS